MGDQLSDAPLNVTPFHSAVASNIPIHAYFLYVSVNSGLSDNQAIINLILIERLCNSASLKGIPLVINSLTIHR